ncbi:MAG: hypothetical protein ABSB40_07280 [Nitrososphaeria archaeon]|jgi:hypothetical protein
MSSIKAKNVLLVTFIVLTIIFGSLFFFESVRGPTSTTLTSSTTFTTTATTFSNVTTTVTENETVTRYITNQFFRTTPLTTPFTTSFPYDGDFSARAGSVLVSVWVEENGILLNLTCVPSFKVGDTFVYFITMKNVNNTSHLSLLEMQGEFNLTIFNSKGSAVWWEWGPYATGPVGPPPPNFVQGFNWTESYWWDTGTNLPNQLGPGSPPAKPAPGNYTLVA